MMKKGLKTAIIFVILLILSISYIRFTLAQECVVEAISYSKDSPAAMIDGHACMIGESACGGKIVGISSDKVTIQFADKKLDFSIAAGELSPKKKIDTAERKTSSSESIQKEQHFVGIMRNFIANKNIDEREKKSLLSIYFLLVIPGILIINIGYFWGLIRVFKRSLLWGIICLFLPIVQLFLLIAGRKQLKKPFLMVLFGILLLICARALLTKLNI